ncbi:uncharacterized protein CTRU02_210322 [Colletotrichum truncatum]|uniref:Uncharacterized protein n=1 Tax=Colletotrichum truncatum TaxID=5467 RepID=A0ACC3YUW0_COLTU|nr:uncharacterized protein CTRU02_11536 [Colletotrichum truncatum]KAF6785911.1 hypothetical protein CTRU02_11536 [Colletotrichum truncatum]
MQLLRITIFTFLAGYGLAVPTTQKVSRSAQEVDPLIAAGKKPPINLSWEYCQKTCDCTKFDKDEDYDRFFQCFTNPNCEECARKGMTRSFS